MVQAALNIFRRIFPPKMLSNSTKVKDLASIYLMVGIPYIFFLIFVIYPLLWVLRYSFYSYDGVRAKFIGLENFSILFGDSIWWKSVVNTIIYTMASTFFGILFALILAVILNMKIKRRVFFRAVFYFPCLISAAVTGVVFRILLSPDNGIFNEILLYLRITDKPVYILESAFAAMLTLVLINLWQWTGYYMTLILAGLQKIPNELYEAAKIDGANSINSFIYITIPQLGQMLQVIVMLSMLGGLKVFDLVNVLTRGYPNHGTETMVTYIFNYFFATEGYSGQQGYAAAASVIASFIIGIVTYIYLKISKNMSES